jgi:hypothetical protein
MNSAPSAVTGSYENLKPRSLARERPYITRGPRQAIFRCGERERTWQDHVSPRRRSGTVYCPECGVFGTRKPASASLDRLPSQDFEERLAFSQIAPQLTSGRSSEGSRAIDFRLCIHSADAHSSHRAGASQCRSVRRLRIGARGKAFPVWSRTIFCLSERIRPDREH